MVVKLELCNPGGILEMTAHYAPRLATLSGKTVCELSNDHWLDYRTFPLIRELLRTRVPTAKLIPYTEFPLGTYKIDVEDIGEIMKAKGCQAVIGGNSG